MKRRAKRTLRTLALAAGVLAMAHPALGQATVDNPAASAADIAARLTGPGLTISNPVIPAANGSDAPEQYGLFSNGIIGAGLRIERGVALNTGTAADQFGPNNDDNASLGPATAFADPTLTAVDSNARFNAAIIEFDVTLGALATGLEIEYQFGSDEYPDYVGSTFNDLFAFFISGPGITGEENIALTPNGGRVRINNINIGTRGCQSSGATVDLTQSSLYIRNGHVTNLPTACQTGVALPGPFPVVTEYNGITSLMTARRSGLTGGQTYRIKMAVADVGDNQFDSGVFIRWVSATFDRDYGDAPNTGTYGDPYHQQTSTRRLGNTITFETAGFNSPTASGDIDDGVVMPASFTAGQARLVNVSVQGGSGGFLQGWIDWNRDGDFDDLGERVAADVQDLDADGAILLPVTAPVLTGTGQTFARFRWSGTAGLGPRGAAVDGEVEDYTLNLLPPGPAPTCPAGRSLLGQAGNAVAVTAQTGVANATRALGALAAQGTTPPDASSAELDDGTDLLTLDLGVLAAQGSQLTLSLARDGGLLGADGDNTIANILVSPDNTAYASLGTYGAGIATFPSVVQDVLERILLTVPAGGTRYVRFDTQNNDDLFVDGVQYAFHCAVGAELEAAKTVRTFDPLAEGLYAVPGNDVVYEITVTNRGAGATDNGTMLLIDRVPDDVTFFNGDVDGPTLPETGVVAFINGGSGLSFTPATDLAFSNAATQPSLISQCTYVPAPGYDPAVTHVCLNPKGAMAAGDPDPFFRVEFRARIK